MGASQSADLLWYLEVTGPNSGQGLILQAVCQMLAEKEIRCGRLLLQVQADRLCLWLYSLESHRRDLQLSFHPGVSLGPETQLRKSEPARSVPPGQVWETPLYLAFS